MNANTIRRDRYDLVVVGGGVYGIMTALEATRRGLRPALLERAEFAAATSANSLRILHGGLRYLQSLDLPRSLESIRERAWWLRNFPDQVLPLPCLMPLYGDGLRRPLALGLALGLNDLLGRFVGDLLPPGRVVEAKVVRDIFPAVFPHGLKGGAVWYDAFAPEMPRLLLEILGWACAEGAVALGHVEALGLLVDGVRCAGVRARDCGSGAELQLRAPVVINTAGPWAPAFAAACGGEAPGLFVPTLAWNIAFRRTALADHALAVAPRRKGAQIYFVVPWQGVMLAGTGHAVWHDGPEPVSVPEPLLEAFIADLNAAVPGLRLGPREILRVFAGLLPAQRAGAAALAKRAAIVDHGAGRGPAGLYSVSGIKLTTARAVAARLLDQAFPSAAARRAATFGRPRLVAGPSNSSGARGG